MEKLNELVVRAKAACDGRAVGYMEKVNPHTILAIAAAFREMKRRAEAAEAKLAELEKQDPASSTTKAQLDIIADGSVGSMFASKDMPVKLFTRPAPAINLAELVPDEMTPKQASRSYGGEVVGYRDGFNACIAEIMRNIEESK